MPKEDSSILQQFIDLCENEKYNSNKRPECARTATLLRMEEKNVSRMMVSFCGMMKEGWIVENVMWREFL